MNKLKEQELELLAKICKENELSTKLAYDLLRSAEKFSYENTSENHRKKIT
ncbi:DNA modification system-associated small protein [Bacillus cereus]